MISVGLSADPLDVTGVLASLRGGTATGAVVTFEGLTRADVVDGRVVVALDYEAHDALATDQLKELADEAQQRWPVTGLVILHRVGRVEVGQPSVFIGVACTHRGEAFDACEWLIDTLKERAAIWKKEVFDDGTGRWVGTPS